MKYHGKQANTRDIFVGNSNQFEEQQKKKCIYPDSILFKYLTLYEQLNFVSAEVQILPLMNILLLLTFLFTIKPI